MRDPYDDRPYTAHAYAETHPGRLAAAARLAGWRSPEVGSARVLELGCGRGGNLLPMAASLPRATFVGVDRSALQIDEARRVAAGAGVTNVTFVRADFDGMELAEGTFDYVVCHGVFSWLAPSTRRRLLERIAVALSARGVACVSFNVLPGWYDKLASRDWLRFGAASMGVTPEGAAESLAWLAAQVSPERRDYARRFEAIGRRLEEAGPAYAFHEYLAEEHHPLHVATFLHEASASRLDYLGDAIPSTTALELLSDEARARARSLDASAAEQFVDFIQGTAFRRSLLVRAADTASRAASPRSLDPLAIRSLRIASRLRAQSEAAPAASQETFAQGEWVVQVSHASARRALHELAKEAPRSLGFDELARRALGSTQRDTASAEHPDADAGPLGAAMETLAVELFDVWLATGGLDLRVDEPVLATRAAAGERPVACPLARWHAEHGGVITSRLHEEVLVPDRIVRWLLARLDGTRTLADLVREARSLEWTREATDSDLVQLVSASVDRLFACSLVIQA